MNRGQAIVHTDNIEFARDGVAELGAKAYVHYNEPGIESYEEDKRWENHNDSR